MKQIPLGPVAVVPVFPLARTFVKRSLFASLVLLLIGFPQALAQTLEWNRFSPSEFDFSVLFPGTPTKAQPEVDKRPDGSVQSTTYLFECVKAGLYSGFAVTDYNFTVDPEGEMSADRDNLVKGVKGTLVTSRRSEFVIGNDRFPELIFTMEVPSLNYVGKSIVVVKGDRAYMAVFLFERNRQYTTEMEKFLDSIEIGVTRSP